MARILLAWELGAGMGHLMPLAQLASALHARGHTVHLALRELGGAATALGALARAPRVQLWQAPVWLASARSLPQPATHTEVLFRAGYLDADRLTMLVQAWRSLLQATAADLLVADHAPTALLAARGLPLRRASFGAAFLHPPAVQPWPVFRDWEPVDPQRVRSGEAQVLAACNAVLQALAAPPLGALHELMAVDVAFLLTWPELDPYGADAPGRPGVQYWGPMPTPDSGAPAHWPDGPGPALFGYLQADYGALPAVLQQLAEAPWRSLLYVSGLSSAQRQQHARGGLHLAPRAVSMASALSQAQAVLCHGSAGTAHAALRAGLPLVLLPTHVEQLLFTRRVQSLGAGLGLLAGAVAGQFTATTAVVLADGPERRAARALAAAHPEPPEQRLLALVQRCEALAAAPATRPDDGMGAPDTARRRC